MISASRVLNQINVDSRQKVKPYYIPIPEKVLIKLSQRNARQALDDDSYKRISNLVLMEGVTPFGRGSEGFHNQLIDWLFFYYPQWNEGNPKTSNTLQEFHYFRSGASRFVKD